MIGLGQISTLGRSSVQLFEARLFKDVATVDQKEAEQGALRSDSIRLKSQGRDGTEATTMKDMVAKMAELKEPEKVTPEQEVGDDCEIAKARRESATGENAPLGWLTSDQMGEEPEMEDLAWPELMAPKEFHAGETSFLATQSPQDEEDFLFANEWFLSPCG